MTIVDFYEKPGCQGNARQKQLLQAAGHHLRVHNLLTEPWTAARLQLFFDNCPVADWFNPTAPPITRGEVNPQAVDADEALALMVQQPILIRRPLLQVGDRYMAGFHLPDIDTWLGLTPNSDLTQDVQTCPHTRHA